MSDIKRWIWSFTLTSIHCPSSRQGVFFPAYPEIQPGTSACNTRCLVTELQSFPILKENISSTVSEASSDDLKAGERQGLAERVFQMLVKKNGHADHADFVCILVQDHLPSLGRPAPNYLIAAITLRERERLLSICTYCINSLHRLKRNCIYYFND